MSIKSRLTSLQRRIKNKTTIVSGIERKNGYVSKNVKLMIDGVFQFGDKVKIVDEGIDNFTRSQIHVVSGARLLIGNNVGISQSSIICKEQIIIGDYVKIGAGTLIFDTNFHSIDWQTRRGGGQDLQNAKCSPIHIMNDVFIGTRCIITKGVTIGERAIIAAGSVVVSDIPNDCIAGGNPCKVIKYLV